MNRALTKPSSLTLISVCIALLAACSSSPQVNGKPNPGDVTGDGPDGGGPAGTGGGNDTFIGVGGDDAGNGNGNDTCDNCTGEYDWGDAGPACGDSVVNVGEECDDGNSLPGDGCNGQCQVEPYSKCSVPGEPCTSTIACGDGKVDPGEFCDDGNNDDDDGCSSDCINQDPTFYCPTPGEPCVRLYACGDSRVNGSDECDDGNNDDDDGCSSDCEIEEGYSCRQPGQLCSPAKKCGNAALDEGEECDDGALEPGDGCSTFCTEEPYWNCNASGCESTIICGNGLKDPGETCDDNNLEPDDGCSDECQQDPAYVCTQGEACIKIIDCGDGKVAGLEQCDDSNKDSLDGCSEACQLEEDFTCPAPGQPCAKVEYCGDGTKQGDEACDDGDFKRDDDQIWNDGCSGICMVEAYYDCPTEGLACISTIDCGNGVLEPGEECDDGDSDGDNPNDGCDNSCVQNVDYRCVEPGEPCIRLNECGDNKITGTEACDDGNAQSEDGCSSACQLEEGYVCTAPPDSTCAIPEYCGDGIKQASEECDDGDVVRNDAVVWNDGCSGVCKLEPYYACNVAGQACASTVNCGNGVLEPGEECDDGDSDSNNPNDGCNNACVQDFDYLCLTVGQPCVLLNVCGDNQITGSEQCDDGDNQDLDGCSSACQLEAGYVCTPPPNSVCSIPKFCGDGLVESGTEECDDGDIARGDSVIWNDGCSGACTIDSSYWLCSTPGQPCASIIECGDNAKQPGEYCDDGDTNDGDGCEGDCKSKTPGYNCVNNVCTQLFRCGDGKVSRNPPLSEECDDGDDSNPNDGCHACQLDDDYQCPSPGDPCEPKPRCGDGTRDPGEQCDHGGNTAQGCSGTCTFTANWTCDSNGNNCAQLVCGDGLVNAGEACDDGNTEDEDGCAADCTEVEEGFTCPRGGFDCRAVCGDGLKRGQETCDDDDTDSGDGCSADCAREANYGCTDDEPSVCTLTVCGDGDEEGDEGCDDGNLTAGDGCGPTCQNEPTFARNLVGSFYEPVAQLTCGDGLITTGEDCDDGNILDDDGCSSACDIEDGYTCSSSVKYPDAVNFKVTYRDFKQRSNTEGGHPHMRQSGTSPPDQGNDFGITGALCTTANQASCSRLDVDGKPTYVGSGTHNTIDPASDSLSATYHQNAFKLWYRDTNASNINDAISEADGMAGTNVPIRIAPNPGQCVGAGGICETAPAQSATVDTLALAKQSNVGNSNLAGDYQFSSNSNTFYPLGNATNNMRGFGAITASSTTRNWHFTSELRYFFQYQGGETLSFFGDDDVWVFVNGRLAVDIGGIHGTAYGRVVLGDEDSSCTTPTTGTYLTTPPVACTRSVGESSDTTDGRFGMTKGGVYEIVVFQAERHPTGSNYQLTLSGFLAPRSFCTAVCGDGFVTPDEECDDGTVGIEVDPPDSVYNTASAQYNRCTTACVLGPYCGDNTTTDGEQCDNGTNISGYGETGDGTCAPGCVTPPNCGDGTINGAEECDLGDASHGNGNTANGYDGCTTSCNIGGFCGDGTPDSPQETCDDGANDGSYGSCTASCQDGPDCGDGTIQTEWGEECDPAHPQSGGSCALDCRLKCGNGTLDTGETCDDGINDDSYAGCSPTCQTGPSCGDNDVDSPFEQCDDGTNDGGYEQCGPNCQIDQYCGDGEVNLLFEECDDGINPGSYNRCDADCTWGPRCGDGVVSQEWGEQCDPEDPITGANCTETCRVMCGNGIVDNGEECDDRINAGGYGRCQADCTNGPSCGDGNVDPGFEGCDEGPAGNDGGYNQCSAFCQVELFCGDGKITSPNEQCDDRVNDGGYGECAEGCVPGERCGDGTVQEEWGEQCDPEDEETGANCTASCRVKCGNGIVDQGEECDDRVNAGGYNRCQADCTNGPSCGDGNIDQGFEACDEGPGGNDGGYNQCSAFCQVELFCGDGKVTNPPEQCDDHVNDGGYGECAVGCVWGERCGDGTVQADWGEECDPEDEETGDNCTNTCRLIGTCGDGIPQENLGEECDDGLNAGGYGMCAAECQWGPRCGDGVVQSVEECDDGEDNNGQYGGCTNLCGYAPRCGDGVVNEDEGESCDDGINDNAYGSCTPECGRGPRCGDNVTQTEWGEQCDGEANCSDNCRLGASCGDKKVQKDLGEQCDDGVNDGGYGECGPLCKIGPRCGDAVVQPSEEKCDDGVNDGGYGECFSGCKLGDRCGDGTLQSDYEQCDDGNRVDTDDCNNQCKRRPPRVTR